MKVPHAGKRVIVVDESGYSYEGYLVPGVSEELIEIFTLWKVVREFHLIRPSEVHPRHVHIPVFHSDTIKVIE